MTNEGLEGLQIQVDEGLDFFCIRKKDTEEDQHWEDWGFLLPASWSRKSCGVATECQKPALELRVPPAAALHLTGTLPPTDYIPLRSGGQVNPPPPGPAPGRGRRHFPSAPPRRRHPALSAGPRPLGGVAYGWRQRALLPLGKGQRPGPAAICSGTGHCPRPGFQA